MNHTQVLSACPAALREYITGALDHIAIGSRVFGYATAQSDYDFVVLRPEATSEDDLSGLGAAVEHRSNPDYPDTGQPLNFKVEVQVSDDVLPVLNTVPVNVIVVNSHEVFRAWCEARDLCVLLRNQGVVLTREFSLAIHTAKVEQYDV